MSTRPSGYSPSELRDCGRHLDASEDSVLFLPTLLHAERLLRGTCTRRRALSTYKQAVLVLRWFLDDTRVSDLARDNDIVLSAAYDYRDEGVTVLAAREPSLLGALLAAKAASHSHVIVDGTLMHTDRIFAPCPAPGADLWWSGKHHHHGGNIQVVSAPDGWPLWTSDVRPGREHDISAAHADPNLLAAITDWINDGALALADLGHEGEPETFTIPFKKPRKDSSPSTSRPATRFTAPCGASANAPTPCSRPATRPCAATAAAPGISATVLPPP